MSPRMCVITCCVIAYVANAAEAPQGYSIKFDRPSAVGEKFRVRASGTLLNLVSGTVDHRKIPDFVESYSASIEAIATVVQVTPTGLESEISYVITRCVRSDNQGEHVIAPRGSVLIARVNGDETEYELQQGSLPAGSDDVLDIVLSMRSDDGLSGDAWFGTNEQNEIGDTWPMNAKSAAANLSRHYGKPVKEDGLTGTATLNSLKRVHDMDCLEIATKHVVNGPLPGYEVVLPGEHLKNMVINTAVSSFYPVDVTLSIQKERFVLELEAKYEGTQGPAKVSRTMKVSMRRTCTSEFWIVE